MDTYGALVIVLSIVLAINLVLGIIALVKFIQILNRIKVIIEKAEAVADRAEHISEFFQKTTATAALAKLVGNISGAFKGHSHKRRGKD